MNALTPTSPAPTANPLIPQTLDDAIRVAKIMADMKLVPAHLQGHVADCMLVVEQALRWRMSPFAVAQCTSVIGGKLMFEGKLVGAALHTSGILASRLNYEFSGQGDTRQVRCFAKLIGETEPRDVVVKLVEVRTKNSMWQSQPDQQLCYSANRIWGRRHASEAMMGIYAPEEFDQPLQMESQAARKMPHAGPTIEGAVELKSAPLEDDDIPSMDEAPAKKPKTLREVLTEALAAATSMQDVEDVKKRAAVAAILRDGPEDQRKFVQDMLDKAAARFAEPPPIDAEASDDGFPGGDIGTESQAPMFDPDADYIIGEIRKLRTPYDLKRFMGAQAIVVKMSKLDPFNHGRVSAASATAFMNFGMDGE